MDWEFLRYCSRGKRITWSNLIWNNSWKGYCWQGCYWPRRYDGLPQPIHIMPGKMHWHFLLHISFKSLMKMWTAPWGRSWSLVDLPQLVLLKQAKFRFVLVAWHKRITLWVGWYIGAILLARQPVVSICSFRKGKQRHNICAQLERVGCFLSLCTQTYAVKL